MTAKAALCKALLDGQVLNIKNGFDLLSITNIPREIGRSIERSFGVKVTRKHRESKSRYGQYCTWVDYTLVYKKGNLRGIKKMKNYVTEQTGGRIYWVGKDRKAHPRKSQHIAEMNFL